MRNPGTLRPHRLGALATRRTVACLRLPIGEGLPDVEPERTPPANVENRGSRTSE